MSEIEEDRYDHAKSHSHYNSGAYMCLQNKYS